ncbi:MAG: LysM peptidoglycan-binding domain-containing protein [Bacillus sp. (in: Bacteria)]|nr:LysM peptidoglycan-binding domain-containing protein [Bacillus sp. (in: firmicutes)]
MKKTIFRALSTAALLSTVYAGSALADTYQVQNGDNLSEIAFKYQTSVNELKTLNNLKSDLIFINQTLKISTTTTGTVQPSQSTTHIVVPGDSLIKIANRYQVTVGELKLWNSLDNTIIYVGEALKVSAPKPTLTVPTPVTAPTTKAPVTPTKTSEYTIKSGDSLSKIALQFKMTVAQLKTLNNLSSDMIYAGSTLKVSGTTTVKPPAATKPPVAKPPVPTPVSEYQVKSGDTLGEIAGLYNISLQALKTNNNLTSDMIYVGQKLKVSGKAVTTPTPAPQTDFAAKTVAEAKKLIGIPYVWGGSTTAGFDCSGFIYYVANQAGLKIGRTNADGYYNRTFYVDQPKAGDLVFFENTYKKGISHVGIYLGDNQFIHANDGGVMISNLSSAYYQKHFSAFKRFY